MQKISQDTWLQKDRAAPESYAGGQTFIGITENNFTDPDYQNYGLLEQILSPANLNRAFKKVRNNKGSAGVDKMDVESLQDYLITNKELLIQSILEGKYRPNPVRRVHIPKANSKNKRSLGIPSVVDRVIQQAMAQVLSPTFEKQFSPQSYGFRPNRSAHKAVKQCQAFITAGYKYAVDMDLEKFFDTVSQSKLIEVLSRTIKDGRVVSLIHKYLRAGVMERGRLKSSKRGVPQGGPLSPLLSNIILNELDQELHRRGHRFVRYADDLVILCKSKRSAQRSLRNIIPFIENKLYLKVNQEKTAVGYISRIKFLGYGFYKRKEGCRLRAHPSSITRMRKRIKELTNRSNGWGNEHRKQELRQYIRGWVNYFKLADMKTLMPRIDEWYRRRLRMIIWKQWKRIRTRFSNLLKLGLSKSKVREFANTRKGYWHIASSPILNRTITTERLAKAGYTFFTDCYRKVRVN
ncbi:group II intron reverse transcriptase/maturase [Salegentibacter agarivorans]|jgi:group II intron reverse transcriptase/maturase|uniref:Group II intron reverse transcriptase/maturase n=1 Tax=Salegentibacter agarivorans TaxID=345907 RepID=A0A1I2N9G6_9FLAO|nr:group II intron reverse transcriptase/maturase [Salegentibacter agarivorans]SFF98021.1 group II intron reverse transcriptase/maturase [Salegentibacter agarivorans]